MSASAEMARILALPCLEPETEDSPVVEPPGAPLFAFQRGALNAWAMAVRGPDTAWGPAGLAVLAGCGAGKTLLSLLLPAVAAGAVRGPWNLADGTPAPPAPTTLYLTPASAVGQLERDAQDWRAAGYPVAGPLVLSHETLSSPGSRHILRDIAPAIIVIDEAHRFAHPESARWRRVAEYLQLRPETRVVIMSGSLTWRSLRQCRHLLLAATRAWCPLPATRELDYWASALDADTEPSSDDLRVVAPLVAWATARLGLPMPGPVSFRESARLAYGRRLRTAPGVVYTEAVAAPVALSIDVAHRRHPPAVVDALARLGNLWELPDGTELYEATAYARARITLALGLYLRWRPETVHPAYLAASREWNAEVRRLVAYMPHIYQTPGAVLDAARDGRLQPTAQRLWAAFEAAEANYPAPETEAVWLPGAEDYAATVAREWLYAPASHPHPAPGLIWVQTPALGERLAARLGLAYHGAGSAPPTGASAVVSVRVHGTGWNGAPASGYRRALVLEPPASGATWEQLLARLHRADSTEDVHYTVHGSEGATAALENALSDARYSRALTGPQRLLLADWRGFTPARTGHHRA